MGLFGLILINAGVVTFTYKILKNASRDEKPCERKCPYQKLLNIECCALCTKSYKKDGMNKMEKLTCGHGFHVACLRKFFSTQMICPRCKIAFSLIQQEEYVLRFALS